MAGKTHPASTVDKEDAPPVTSHPVNVFPEWCGKPLAAALAACRELVAADGVPALRRWREAGGKVAGHFQVYFPEEIVHAAGMLPFKVCGAARESARAASRFGSCLCTILKTSLEAALAGDHQFDLFVAPAICDAARNLAAIWERNVNCPCTTLHLPQNPASAHAAEYLHGEYERLRGAATDAALRRSIGIYNENRRLLRDLYAVKSLIAAEDAYALLAVGGMIPREEHNELLKTILPQLHGEPDDRVRVVFTGAFCEQPPLDLIHAIGRACHIVDDDVMIGLRYLTEDVPLEGDPLANLARAYLDHPAGCPVQHDPRKPKERTLLDRIGRAGAQAAILAAPKMCEPALDDLVAQTRALESCGIPFFVVEFEENMTSLDTVELQIETFIENLP